MTKTSSAAILIVLGSGAAIAAPPMPARSPAPAGETARAATQRSILAEKMGQMQLDMLVSDVLDEAGPRAKAEPRHELSMVTFRR